MLLDFKIFFWCSHKTPCDAHILYSHVPHIITTYIAHEIKVHGHSLNDILEGRSHSINHILKRRSHSMEWVVRSNSIHFIFGIKHLFFAPRNSYRSRTLLRTPNLNQPSDPLFVDLTIVITLQGVLQQYNEFQLAIETTNLCGAKFCWLQL